MLRTVEAIYENGVLRPLEPLELADHQHVQLTISPTEAMGADVSAYFDSVEWEASKHDAISLADVRRGLASIRGSLAEAVNESRNERW